MKLNIIHITPDFKYACGRSYYVYLLLKYISRKHNVTLLTDGGDSFDRLVELNINYICVKNLHSKNPFSLAKNIRFIQSLINSFQPQVLHTHHRCSEFLAVYANKLSRKKIFTVLTALSLVDRKYFVEYKSDRIIAVSSTVKDMLINRFNVNSNKITRIPNFVDTDEIKGVNLASTAQYAKPNKYTLLAIGRFHRDKNFELILKAMRALNSKGLRLLLVGEGELHKVYREYIDRYNLDVEIHKPSRYLCKYFLSADICILPSIKDPFPNFMLQSGLYKRPFIGSNVDGISELIIDGYNGLLFKSNDHIELAEKIKLFLYDKELATKCANNLYNEVRENYTQESVIPQIEGLYLGLLN